MADQFNSPPDVIRKEVLTIGDITFTHAIAGSDPDAVDTVMNYILWDEISEFTYIKETIVFTTNGVGTQSLIFDYPKNDGGENMFGWLAEPEHYDESTTGVLATGFARWKSGWNKPVSYGNAHLWRVEAGLVDDVMTYKYQIECEVNADDAVLGVTFNILEIELNYNTEPQ